MKPFRPLAGSLLATALSIALAATAHAAPAAFRRGDANADSAVDVSDPIRTLGFLFAGGLEIPCEDAADSNDDGRLDLSDPIHTLVHLFNGGEQPPFPGGRCGTDPTADALGCAAYRPCEPGGTASLRPAESCEEVLVQLRASMVAGMEESLARNLEIALQLASYGGCWLRDAFLGPAAGSPAPPSPSGTESASEFSGTNNQVEGVDEPDFVKTDGAYVYIVAGGRFRIIDAWPAPDTREVASVALEGTPKKLFVLADRAVVYSSLEPLHVPDQIPLWDWGLRPIQGGECTYGYDCEFTGDGRKLRASVFDIGDRSRPRLLREIDFNGSFLNARRIGTAVHTVAVFPEVLVPGVSYWPEELTSVLRCELPFPYTEEEIRDLFAALRERNLALIENAAIGDVLPSITDTRLDGPAPVVTHPILENCSGFYISPAGDGRSFVTLASFAIDAAEDLAVTTILGRPGAVYASGESLYLATRQYGYPGDPWGPGPEPILESTTVHKFELLTAGPGSAYLGSGSVKGRILNQFSMDEHEGHLRIATTTGHLPSPDVHSTVSVLAEQAEELVLVGQVDGLAPSEDIRSVRFSGDVGFVVTFKKTDPLFVLDLSDPQAPAVRGELKIPGFSTYMHMLDAGHILSIGYDADDQGSFAWFQGILLQVFDVTDLSDPRLLHRELIGTRGSTSDAATNHLAFTYFAARKLLAIPIVVCEGGSGGQNGMTMTFNGLMVYRAGVEEGFQFLGGVPHASESPQFHCGNWWTQSNSTVKRSIFMDDFVYSIALDAMQVSHLGDLEHPVATVGFPEAP